MLVSTDHTPLEIWHMSLSSAGSIKGMEILRPVVKKTDTKEDGVSMKSQAYQRYDVRRVNTRKNIGAFKIFP